MEDEKKTQAPAEETTVKDEKQAPAVKETEKPKKEKKEKTGEAAKLKKEVEKLQQGLSDEHERYQRMLAEYANFKRRTEQEKEQIGQFTTGEVLKKLLPSLDNLERAAEAPDGESYKQGVEMVMKALQEAVISMGLTEIEAAGQPFDPEQHHAVMREDADGVEPDTVTQVFQKGYRLGERVLRPAMVKVAN